MGEDLSRLDVATLRRYFADRSVSPVDHVRAVLERLDECEPWLSSFITIDRDNAVAAAREAERRITELGTAAFRDAPLLGMAVSVKDLIPTKGLRTTRGSAKFADWVPDYDPPVVQRLRRAGAVLLGKTNTSESGWSGSTCNRLVPPTRNPWNRALGAGGSSGGAAASVAMGIGVAGVGTDGAGSVRIPAAFCGVVGFKPSFGRIPYVPTSPENLSHIGTLTRTVDDAAAVFDVLAGPDARDPYSLPRNPADAVQGLAERSGSQRLRVGWVLSFGSPATDPEIARLARDAVDSLAAAGHVVEPVEVPFEDPYPSLEVILATAEAAAHDGDDEAIDPGLLEVIELGRTISGTELAGAVRCRAQLADSLRELMCRYDVLATATVPIGPFPAGLAQPESPIPKGRLPWLSWTPATYPFNLSGYPAISVPAGFNVAGLPVGLQLSGGWREDLTVLRAAKAVQDLRPWQASYDALLSGGETGDPS